MTRCHAILFMASALVLTASSSCGQSAPPITPAPGGALAKPPVTRYIRSAGGYEARLVAGDHRNVLALTLASAAAPGLPPLPMTERLEMWRPLVEQLFRERGRQLEYLVTVGEYPELKRRIIDAAACSDEWDPSTGQPRGGRPDEAIKDLLTQAELYPEIGAFFTSLGYATSIDHAEGVMICRTDAIDRPAVRCSGMTGVVAMAPCGASIVFKLTRRDSGRGEGAR